MRIKNYTPVFDEIVKRLDPTAAVIFGRIWRYAQGSGVCYAGLSTIANACGVSVNTARRKIEDLMEHDYLLEDEYVIGKTRKLRPAYDIMVSYEMVKTSANLVGGDTTVVGGDTTVVGGGSQGGIQRENKETKKDILQGMVELQGKTDPFANYPVHMQDILRQFWAMTDISPLKSNKTRWIATGEEWYAMGIKVADIHAMIEYVDWEYSGPWGLTAAFNMLKVKKNDWQEESKKKQARQERLYDQRPE